MDFLHASAVIATPGEADKVYDAYDVCQNDKSLR